MHPLRNFLLHSLYFASWTLVPLTLSAFSEYQREETFILTIAFGILIALVAHLLDYSRWFYVLTLPLLAIPGITDLGHVLLYQGRPTDAIFFSVFDTSLSEVHEFFLDYVTPFVVLSNVLYVFILTCFMIWCLKKKPILSKKNLFIFSLAGGLPFLFAGLKSGDRIFNGNSGLQTLASYLSYKKQMSDFQNLSKTSVVLSDPVLDLSQGPSTHVLIIGESAARAHWGLYGYYRETTPRIKSERDLHVFSKVICPTPPSTFMNIQKILTITNNENLKNKILQPNLVQMAKKAGYYVTWISNQPILGLNDNMTSVIAGQADKLTFLNKSKGRNYDSIMLPHFQKALDHKAQKKLIILHLMGNHSVYQYRYPKEFDVFKETPRFSSDLNLTDKEKQKINEYDNSTLYQDFILQKMFEMAKKQAHSAIFISDHGEEIFDEIQFNGHTEVKPTKNMYQIPFLLWSKKTSHLTIQTNREFITENLIHSLLQLYQWDYVKAEKNKSLWAKEYQNPDPLKVKKKIIPF